MSLRYMLDTNICIYISKEKPVSVLNKFEKLAVGEMAMSIITYGELFYGVQHSHHAKANAENLEKLIALIPALPLPIDSGKYYGEIRNKLEKKGNLIGNNDLWIASHALSLNLILVTNNTKEFSRIPNLKVENWVY